MRAEAVASDVEPSAVEAGAVEPSAVEPSAVEPSAVEPSAVEPSAVEPSAVEPSAGVDLSALGAQARERFAALPLPRARRPRPRTCEVRSFTYYEGDDAEPSEWWEDSLVRDWFDAAGRWTRRDWNADAVALSGEVRARYARDGAPTETREIPFEAIDGAPRTPPVIRHAVSVEGDETVVVSRRGDVVGRIERYRFDASNRVVWRSRADAWELEGDPFLTEATLPEPTITGCRYDERGRVASIERALPRWFVYEGDVLVSVAQELPDGTTFEQAALAIDGGFVLVSEGVEVVERYLGDCAASLFEPCAAAWAPPPPGPVSPMPAITFGRAP